MWETKVATGSGSSFFDYTSVLVTWWCDDVQPLGQRLAGRNAVAWRHSLLNVHINVFDFVTVFAVAHSSVGEIAQWLYH